MGEKTRAEIARDNFARGYNCGQAVFVSFGDVTGLEEAAAARLTNCLGGGFSQTGGLCGAVSGACLALSAEFGRDTTSRQGEQLERQAKTYGLVQHIHEQFRDRYGAVDCPALLERGLEDSGREKNNKHNCGDYVALAAGLVEAELKAAKAVAAAQEG